MREDLIEELANEKLRQGDTSVNVPSQLSGPKDNAILISLPSVSNTV